MKSTPLSEVEELVLLAAGLSRENAYGFAVKAAIREETGRSLSLATVHAALYRLENKGYLCSSLGGATKERGGRRKRLFTITSAGLQTLRARAEVRMNMWETLRQLHPSRGVA